jgi:hypothetical protein
MTTGYEIYTVINIPMAEAKSKYDIWNCESCGVPVSRASIGCCLANVPLGDDGGRDARDLRARGYFLKMQTSEVYGTFAPKYGRTRSGGP